MKSIQKAVEEIVYSSDIPFFALQDGVLNLSAYAKQIRIRVQNKCKKPIRSVNGIVMALSRLQQKIGKKKVVLPKISVTAVTLKHGLCEFSIYKTPEAIKFIQKLLSAHNTEPQILLVTYGLSQINLIMQNMDKAKIKKMFAAYTPSAIVSDLASITLSIPEEDVLVPNIFYSIFSRFAAKEINVVEIATAKLELTLIVQEKVLGEAYGAMSDIIQEKEKLY